MKIRLNFFNECSYLINGDSESDGFTFIEARIWRDPFSKDSEMSFFLLGFGIRITLCLNS